MTDALVCSDFIALAQDGGVVTAAGEHFLAEFGVDVRAIGGTRRAFCRPCLDWSERRPHLAGVVGAALASRWFALGWIERGRHTRAVRISAAGVSGFAETFGIDTEALGVAAPCHESRAVQSIQHGGPHARA